MKKIMLILCAFVTIAANAQNLDEIIANYSKQLGGTEAFNKIKTAKITGTVTVQGMDLPITVTLINGKAVKTDVDVMGTSVISAYKEGKGWKQNQYAGVPDPTPVEGAELAELESQTFMGSQLMNYKTQGHTVVLEGKEDVDGVSTHKIKLTNKTGGGVTHYFINASDYSLVKTAQTQDLMGQTALIETKFSNPKEFGGMKYYMNRVMFADGQEFQSLAFDNVELDLPVDEKIFDMP